MKKDLRKNNAAPNANHRTHRSQVKENLSPLSMAVRSALVGLLWTLPICVLLIFISAAAALKYYDPDSLTQVLGIASLTVSSALCGFISGRKNGRSQLLCSAMSGAALVLLVMILALFVRQTSSTAHHSGYSRSLIYLCTFASSLLGGFLSSRKKRSKHLTRRR